MFKLKNYEEIKRLKTGGRLLARILNQLAEAVRPGVKTVDLDRLARELIEKSGARPSFLNYQPTGAKRPFPAALCVSINDEVVHGIPSERELLIGDIVTLDLGLEYDGLFTDMAITVPVGQISPLGKRIIKVTREALMKGIAVARPNGKLGDIGSAIETFVLSEGFDLVRDFGGHGVGFRIHEEPEVPNYGKVGVGLKLSPGLVIAIEPMVTAGRGEVMVARDGYTVKTRDGSLSAHFEHTIAITETGAEILTWPLTGLTQI